MSILGWLFGCAHGVTDSAFQRKCDSYCADATAFTTWLQANDDKSKWSAADGAYYAKTNAALNKRHVDIVAERARLEENS
jgi:hypothetical protein